MTVILDSSAALALFFGEPGGEQVAERLHESAMSAVNFTEVIAKMIDRGATPEEAHATFAAIGIVVSDQSAPVAGRAGELLAIYRKKGISLADCSCLALTESLDALVLTADTAWAKLGLDLQIGVIR